MEQTTKINKWKKIQLQSTYIDGNGHTKRSIKGHGIKIKSEDLLCGEGEK